MSANALCAADKSNSQKREVTHKETQRTSPCLAQWKRLEHSESSGQGPAAAAKPTSAAQRPWKPRAFSLPSLLSCPPFSGEAGFLCSRCATAGPSWPGATCSCHQETAVSLDQTRGTRQELATFLRVGVQPRSGCATRASRSRGEDQQLGVKGSAWPSAPAQDSGTLAGPPAFNPHG